jgi:hypothetical protein
MPLCEILGHVLRDEIGAARDAVVLVCVCAVDIVAVPKRKNLDILLGVGFVPIDQARELVEVSLYNVPENQESAGECAMLGVYFPRSPSSGTTKGEKLELRTDFGVGSLAVQDLTSFPWCTWRNS